LKLFFTKIFNFLEKDIWQIDLKKVSRVKAFFIHLLKVIIIVIDGFNKKHIQLGASALVYYSLLAIVPSFAILLGIARGFKLEEALTNWLIKRLGEQKDVVNALITFAKTALAEAQSGVIAGIGIIILFWSVIKILGYIESIFNMIWEVKRTRSFARQFSDYLALILICPIFIFIASGVTIYLSATLSSWDRNIPLFKSIAPILFFALYLIPYVVTWILFTFIYIFIPNTHVRFFPALIAGVFTGTIYQIIQSLYVYFQIGVSQYNAIYGTFAALPLFLIWLNISWMILLIGGRIAFAIQNNDSYDFATEKVTISQKCKTILALRITHLTIKNFCEGSIPLNSHEYATLLAIPHILIVRLLHYLVRAGILSEVIIGHERVKAFQPARPIEQLTIKKIIDMMDESGESLPLPSTHEANAILDSLKEFSRLIEKSNANILLKDI